jgi:hypothetical protein
MWMASPGKGSHASGGGAASAFTFINEDTGTNDAGSVTSVTMSSSVTAGNLVVVWVKWEGTGNPTAVTENGGALTALTKRDQASNDLHSQCFYRLSATGGGTSISLTWTGSPTFCKVIAEEFDYGGTATQVAEGPNGADSNPGSGTVNSGTVTNSGTFRLNIALWGAYNSTGITNRLIGGSAATDAPVAQFGNTWTWYNTVNLSTQSAACDWPIDNKWTFNLVSFAAN